MYEYKDIKKVEKELKTDICNGLSNEEVTRRLLKYGKNELESKNRNNILKVFFKQLQDPMIYILLVAVVISVFLKEYNDAVIIILVVLINALISGIQEIKSEKSLEVLKNIIVNKCSVIRDGKKQFIDTSSLVVGDLVVLESGNKVGADLRIVESHDLKIDESSLTGESKPVSKSSSILNESIKSVGDKTNMAYMSSFVVSGKGKGIAVATSMNTEIGKIASLLKENKEELTPLQNKLATLGKILGIVTILICALMFILAIVEKRDILEMFISSISLAVAAIPEGLPAVVTIVLALGIQKISKLKALVKRLPTVETLGAVNVVCSDKTGTITENKLRCDFLYDNNRFHSDCDGVSDELIRCMDACNNAYKDGDNFIGSPIECEIKRILELSKNRLEIGKRIEEKEFNSTRKMMSVLYEFKGNKTQYTKGAFDRILDDCDWYILNGKRVKFTVEYKQKLNEILDEKSSNGMRILAFSKKENVHKIEEKRMDFLGFLAFFDPPRAGVEESVREFKQAGIKTIMITGDHLNTAYFIAKKVGITDSLEECALGRDLENLEPNELDELILKKRVFARVSPVHKSLIVESLQRHNDIVAMTGDGVNDAPSLKKANVGISMGINGNDVAKEASDMILLDDNFSTIEIAIKEGKKIYNNIQKTIMYLLSSNLAEILVMITSVIFGLPMPLLASHILIVNLLTDSIPALCLGVDDSSIRNVQVESRKEIKSFFAGSRVYKTILFAVIISFITMFSFLIPSMSLSGFNLNKAIAFLNDDALLLKSQTYAFISLSVCELVYAYISKSEGGEYANLFNNKFLNASTLVSMIILIIMSVTSLSCVVGADTLDVKEFMGIVIGSLTLFAFLPFCSCQFHMKQN